MQLCTLYINVVIHSYLYLPTFNFTLHTSPFKNLRVFFSLLFSRLKMDFKKLIKYSKPMFIFSLREENDFVCRGLSVEGLYVFSFHPHASPIFSSSFPFLPSSSSSSSSHHHQNAVYLALNVELSS